MRQGKLGGILDPNQALSIDRYPSDNPSKPVNGFNYYNFASALNWNRIITSLIMSSKLPPIFHTSECLSQQMYLMIQ